MKKNRLILSLVICFPVFLFAQGFYENQFQEALQLYDQGRLGEAFRKLKALYDNHPDDLRPVRFLGEIEAKRHNWNNCLDWMEVALNANPNDMLANYYSAIAYRERGKYKALLQRRRDWKKSEDFFNRMTEEAPNFRDIFYQYSLLERYRKNYIQAIELGKKQLELQYSEQVAVKVAHYYASFVRNKRNDFLEWAQHSDDPIRLFYMADAFRIEDQAAKADSIFQLLNGKDLPGLSAVPFFIAHAQCKIALDDKDAALALFQTALDTIKGPTDSAFMFDHLKYIMSDQELLEYNQLLTFQAQRDFFVKMLVKRDPMPANERNMRLVEHLRRYNHAEKYHWYDGFRTEFNNPDKLHYLNFPKIFELNEKFNDKGVVYIRHGEPDDIAFTLHADLDNNESWLYWGGGSVSNKLMFHFLHGETQAGNNWRLIAFLPRVMAESRMDWDPIYARMMVADPLELLALERDAAVQNSKMVQSGLNADRHSWNQEIRSIFFPFYAASFKQGDKVRTELYYGLHPSDLIPKKSEFTTDDSVHVGFSVLDDQLNYLIREHKNVSFQEILQIKDDTFWTDVFTFVQDPGRYHVNINVETPHEEGLGGYKFRYSISDYAGNALKMSSLELAKSISEEQGDARFQKGKLSVIPLAEKRISRKKPLQVYFEIYNLPVQDAELAFQVEYKVKLLQEQHSNVFSRVAGLFKRSQPLVTNRVERFSRDAFSVEYISLDLSNNDPGYYELEVETSVPALENVKTSRTINFEIR